MHDRSSAKHVVGFVCAALPLLTNCSLLIETNDRQCKADADCVSAKLGTLCVDQICVDSGGCQGTACSTSDSVINGKCSDDKQCSSDAAPHCWVANETCVSNEVYERWVCKDDGVPPTIARYGFHIIEYVSRKPPKNIVVKACRYADSNCDDPVDTYVDSDGTGHAQFNLPTPFSGFFDISSDAVPTLLYVTKPIVKSTSNRDLPVPNAQTLGLVTQFTGYAFDPNKGLAFLEALDCDDIPQGGVNFAFLDGTADPFYLINQTPNKDATLTVYDEVTNSANGGFVNVPTGFKNFSARLGVDGLVLGQFNAQIRSGAITFIDMHF